VVATGAMTGLLGGGLGVLGSAAGGAVTVSASSVVESPVLRVGQQYRLNTLKA